MGSLHKIYLTRSTKRVGSGVCCESLSEGYIRASVVVVDSSSMLVVVSSISDREKASAFWPLPEATMISKFVSFSVSGLNPNGNWNC